MKKLLTILFILPLFVHSQTLDGIIDAKIQAAIQSIPQVGVDTVGYFKTFTSSTAFNIDTLTTPVNTIATYLIRLSTSGGTMTAACTLLFVTNTAGVYSVTQSSFKTSASWMTFVTNGGIQIRCLNSIGKPINWEYKRINL